MSVSLQEGVKTENDHINLKVAGQDGSVVQFKIKRHTPLSKLMKAYCERQVRLCPGGLRATGCPGLGCPWGACARGAPVCVCLRVCSSLGVRVCVPACVYSSLVCACVRVCVPACACSSVVAVSFCRQSISPVSADRPGRRLFPQRGAWGVPSGGCWERSGSVRPCRCSAVAGPRLRHGLGGSRGA